MGRALPVGATPEMVTEVAGLAVNGFGGTEVIRIAPAPDIADITELGVRRDGTSIYRPPNETRYATLGQLHLEETVMEHAASAACQLVSEAQAQHGLGSMLSTSDLALILGAARRADAHVIDTATSSSSRRSRRAACSAR